MHTRRHVVNYLIADNQDVKAKEGKNNRAVQESQAFPDPIRWMKLLIWTN